MYRISLSILTRICLVYNFTAVSGFAFNFGICDHLCANWALVAKLNASDDLIRPIVLPDKEFEEVHFDYSY